MNYLKSAPLTQTISSETAKRRLKTYPFGSQKYAILPIVIRMIKRVFQIITHEITVVM